MRPLTFSFFSADSHLENEDLCSRSVGYLVLPKPGEHGGGSFLVESVNETMGKLPLDRSPDRPANNSVYIVLGS